jgi:leucyl-tRNA synthetase
MGGSFRFLQRVWTLTQDYLNRGEPAEAVDDIALKRVMHRAIHQVSKDLEGMGFNTAIAGLMGTVNELYRLKTSVSFSAAPETWRWALETLLLLLAPFTPHITEELWAQLGHDTSVHLAEWPHHDEQYLVSDTMTIVVQINGKVRSQLSVPAGATEEAVIAAAKADSKVAKYISGKEIKKSIYVPGKLVSFVI